MRMHPEIKWTEILRKSIRDYIAKLDQSHQETMQDLRDRLAPDAIAILEHISSQDQEKYHAKAQQMEEERLKRLTRLEQQGDE